MSYSKVIYRYDPINGSDAARPDLTGCTLSNSSSVVSINKTSHGLVNGALVIVNNNATYTGSWLVKVTDADNFTLHTAHARGIMSVTGSPSINNFFTIGSQTFTFKNTRTTTGEVTIGSNIYYTAENMVDAINTDIGGTSSNYMAILGDYNGVIGDYKIAKVAVYHIPPGTIGNSILFTGSMQGVYFETTSSFAGGTNSTYSTPTSSLTITPIGGSSWNDTLKNLKDLATNRFTQNDIFCVKSTSTPINTGISASFTNFSQVVTLQTPLTSNIDYATGSFWSASLNVTAATNASRKLGTTCQSLSVGAAFTTGSIAYKSLPTSTNFSAYKGVSFWIQANAVTTSGSLSLNLCSDISGSVVVNSLPIDAIISTGRWQPVVSYTTSSLGSSIQSVSLYANTDPGTITILINNIVACKDSSSVGSITHQSLIGKNDSTDEWYCVQSIDGTTVKIDSASTTATGSGYYGTTETVPFYRLETAKVFNNFGITSPNSLNYIQVLGGWDSSTNVQIGKTWVDGVNGAFLIPMSSGYYNAAYHKINVCRMGGSMHSVYNGISINCKFTNFTPLNIYAQAGSHIVNCSSYNSGNHGWGNYQLRSLLIRNCRFFCNEGAGAFNGGYVGYGVRFYDTILINNRNSGFNRSGPENTCNIFNNVTSSNNTGYGFVFGSKEKEVVNCLTSNNTTAGIYVAGDVKLKNCTISETNEVDVGDRPAADYYAYSLNHDNVIGNNQILSDGISAVIQNATKGGTGKEWKVVILTNNLNIDMNIPFELPLAQIAVTAGKTVTASVYCTKDSATILSAAIAVRIQPGVVNSEVTTEKAYNTTRESISISFTPLSTGVVEIVGRTWNVTGALGSSTYWDTLTINQSL